jgi:hypothetical protein
MMSNIFNRLLAGFGKEEPFTASLALFIERNKEFRLAFLNWLQAIVSEDLTGYVWEVATEVTKPSQYGDARLDMVLAHPEIELWFEHKIDAPIGKRKSKADDEDIVDQLQKYLDAAARVMTDTNTGETEVTWPQNGPIAGKPRIILFYISRSGSILIPEQYAGKIYGDNQFGLAFPENNRQLRWKDFHPLAITTLSDTLSGTHGVFEATLAQQFLEYWEGIPGMWRQLQFNDAWLELLPPKDTLTANNPASFANYLDDVEYLFVSKLGWRAKEHWDGGTVVVFETSITQTVSVTMRGIRSIEGIPNYSSTLGTEVVLIEIRFSAEVRIAKPVEPRTKFEGISGMLDVQRVNGKDVGHIYVGIHDWDEIHTKDWRYRQIALAFVAGLHMAEQAFDITVDGLDSI